MKLDPRTVHKVDYAWCVGIRVKCLGSTDTKGSRVWRADESYAMDPDAMTLDYDHALSGSENACEAVRQYLAQKAGTTSSWAGRWVLAGHGTAEYVAVRASRSVDDG